MSFARAENSAENRGAEPRDKGSDERLRSDAARQAAAFRTGSQAFTPVGLEAEWRGLHLVRLPLLAQVGQRWRFLDRRCFDLGQGTLARFAIHIIRHSGSAQVVASAATGDGIAVG